MAGRLGVAVARLVHLVSGIAETEGQLTLDDGDEEQAGVRMPRRGRAGREVQGELAQVVRTREWRALDPELKTDDGGGWLLAEGNRVP